MRFSKNNLARFLVIGLGVFVVFYLIFWIFLTYNTLGWQNYENKITRYHYSFSYPKDLVLTECGNGEVVVSKTLVEECEEPLDASEEYTDNVYFQVFIPGNHWYVRQEDISVAENLKGWQTLYFYPDDENVILNKLSLGLISEYKKISNGTSLPVKPANTNIYAKYTAELNMKRNLGEEKRALALDLQLFTVGFYPHKGYGEDFKRINNSLEMDYK